MVKIAISLIRDNMVENLCTSLHYWQCCIDVVDECWLELNCGRDCELLLIWLHRLCFGFEIEMWKKCSGFVWRHLLWIWGNISPFFLQRKQNVALPSSSLSLLLGLSFAWAYEVLLWCRLIILQSFWLLQGLAVCGAELSSHLRSFLRPSRRLFAKSKKQKSENETMAINGNGNSSGRT